MLRRLWTLPSRGVSIPKLLLNSSREGQQNALRKGLSSDTELLAAKKKFVSTVQNGGCFAFCKERVRADNTILSKVISAHSCAENERTRMSTGQVTTIKWHFYQPSGKNSALVTSSLLSPPLSTIIHGLPSSPFTEARRGIIKFSLRKGRRKTANAIKTRFFRLDWGGWISALPGRSKKLWRKSAQKRYYLRNHVLRKGTEVKLLDKLVTKYWIKKKYFVNDPYENYHKREDFHVTKGVQGITSTNLYKIKPYTNKIANCRRPKW